MNLKADVFKALSAQTLTLKYNRADFAIHFGEDIFDDPPNHQRNQVVLFNVCNVFRCDVLSVAENRNPVADCENFLNAM